jgi:hypothetical protein
VPLGNPTNLAEAGKRGAARTAEAARRFAENLAPMIRQVQASGVSSLRGVAAVLNARGVHTPAAAGGPRPRSAPCCAGRGGAGGQVGHMERER